MSKLYQYSLKCKLCTTILFTVSSMFIVKAQKPLPFSSSYQPKLESTIPEKNIVKQFKPIESKIRPFSKDGVFDSKSRTIGYKLSLENKEREDQVGEIYMQITDNSGNVLYHETKPFKIRRHSFYEKEYVFAQGQLQPGFYISSMNITTNKFVDSISYSFGYEPSKIVYDANTPSDFISFWEQAKAELAGVAPNYVVTHRTDLNNRYNDVFEIEFKSIDKGVIKGWLTTPKDKKSHPVLLKISDYHSELFAEFRRDVAVLCINTRGTGASNQNYQLTYDQLGVFNIKNKNKYYLKGVYMDALRSIDFIHQFSASMKLNSNRIVAFGNGLGGAVCAALGAMDARLKGVILENPSFIGLRDMINFGEGMANPSFPASMFLNSFKALRITKETAFSTLDYFDPVLFAPYISCPILTGFSLHNTNVPAQSVYAFISRLRVPKNKVYECKECDNNLDKGFYGLKENWLKEKFGQP